jgi:hypothetical protein
MAIVYLSDWVRPAGGAAGDAEIVQRVPSTLDPGAMIGGTEFNLSFANPAAFL